MCAVSPAKLAALSGPDVPPTREEVKRIIQRMQKKDIYGIFREPVTDEMVRCPYSSACSRLQRLYRRVSCVRLLRLCVMHVPRHMPCPLMQQRHAVVQ